MSLLLSALPHHGHEDLQRVERMLAGDQSAFEAFFEESFDGLYRFALARLDGDESLAQDMVQMTLCKTFEKLDTYRGEAALFTWMCSICRSEISHHFRRSGRSPVQSFGLDEEGPEVRAALEALAAEQPGAEQKALGREMADLVHLALDRLPTRYGQILEWKYFESLPVKEIAERLALGPKAAESLLTRARDAFRQAFSTLSSDLSRPGSPSRASAFRLMPSRSDS